MASITRCGTCVPPGPSRKTAGCLLIVCASAGNCERTQARSIAVDEEEDEEACSAIGIADILNESVVSARVVTGSTQFRRGRDSLPHNRRDIRCPPLKGRLFLRNSASLKRCPDTKRGGTAGGPFRILLRGALGRIRLPALAFVRGVQPDARYSCRFLDQVVGGLSSVARHH